jgi:hypothetical protein
MKPYDKILESIRAETSFGFSTIRVYRPSELWKQQVGYSVGPAGEKLTGENDGDWLPAWTVIGHEGACGDPIFIDASADGFPVYTATHGEGRWDEVQIAVSLAGFGLALSAVADIAQRRENPASLEKKPLAESQNEKTLAAIRRHNPGIDMEFWEIQIS